MPEEDQQEQAELAAKACGAGLMLFSPFSTSWILARERRAPHSAKMKCVCPCSGGITMWGGEVILVQSSLRKELKEDPGWGPGWHTGYRGWEWKHLLWAAVTQ